MAHFTQVRAGGTSSFARTEECEFPTPRPLKVKGDGYASQVSNCKTALTCRGKMNAHSVLQRM